jgi:outer membrane phospholipase A
MKKLLLLILLLPSIIFAINKIEPAETIEAFQPIYFIDGNHSDQVKYSISFKYKIWFPGDNGLNLAYLQIAKWNIYDRSNPFKEIDHSPMVFYESFPIYKWWDFYRIGFYQHLSNGLDGANSRSIDTGFLETQVSYGKYLNFGIREKVICYYSVSNKNKDYKRYKGNFETEIFIQYKGSHGYIDHERFYIKGEKTHKYGWIEIGVSVRILTPDIQPSLYIQYYRGYAEFMIDYNKKINALRAGLIFNI